MDQLPQFHETLLTERIMMRSLRFADVLFYCKLSRNKDVRRYLGGPVAWRRLVSRFQEDRTSQKDVGLWLVLRRKTKSRVGIVSISRHKDGEDLELSYQFHPAFCGQGLASEATEAVLQHVFNDIGVQRVIAETQSKNLSSCRLLERLGFGVLERVVRFGAEQEIYLKRAD